MHAGIHLFRHPPRPTTPCSGVQYGRRESKDSIDRLKELAAQVLGLGVGGTYLSMTGTSMATPHVTGTAAILIAKWVAVLCKFLLRHDHDT